LLRPGGAHFHDGEMPHSPNREGLTKLAPIEGAELDYIERSKIEEAACAVRETA